MNLKTPALAAMAVIVFSIPAFSQQRTITVKEFEDAYLPARKFLTTVNYRSVERNDTSESIYESVPPDRTRHLLTEKIDGVTKTTETINIGPKTFIRKNGRKWQSPGVRSPDRYTVVGDPGDAELINEYKLTAGAMFGNEKTGIYEHTETTTSRSMGFRRVWTQRIWIDEKGMMLKLENIYAQEGGTFSYTVLYEYGPNIKIEAPVKVPAKKKK